MDPFQPFIDYFISRGEWLPAIALAVVVIIAIVAAFTINARSRRPEQRPTVDARGDGNQTTIVTNVKARGDIEISPEQRNG